MSDFLMMHYEWLRAFHIIAVISWMGGMLYLPRLFVYHARARKGFEPSETFKIMERRLLRYIMNPALIASFIFGGLMLWASPVLLEQPWMHAKLTLVFLMAGLHGFLAKTVKIFACDQNTRSDRFYRYLNEVPTLMMILIVLLAVAEPF
jgi:protoporphyrinogen IX oxidase